MALMTRRTRKSGWRSEQRRAAWRWGGPIHDNREMGSSVLIRLGISAALFFGLVAAVRAQARDSATYYLERGVERYNSRDFEGAIADFSEAILVNSGFVKRSDKRLSGSNFKDRRDARIAYDERIVVADSFNALAYYNRGRARQESGDVGRAIDDFNKAIGINPLYTDAYLVRGRAWHSKRDFDHAIADYNYAIELDPRSAFAYNNRGIARKDKQDVRGALGDFDRAIMLNPRLVQAYINRGAARCETGDLSGALGDLNRAIAIEPHNASAYNNRGAVREGSGDLSGALQDYNTAIMLDPENALAFVNRGVARLQQGNIAEAEVDLKRALALDPALKPSIKLILERNKN